MEGITQVKECNGTKLGLRSGRTERIRSWNNDKMSKPFWKGHRGQRENKIHEGSSPQSRRDWKGRAPPLSCSALPNLQTYDKDRATYTLPGPWSFHQACVWPPPDTLAGVVHPLPEKETVLRSASSWAIFPGGEEKWEMFKVIYGDQSEVTQRQQ